MYMMLQKVQKNKTTTNTCIPNLVRKKADMNLYWA